jgi:hypothetical protein
MCAEGVGEAKGKKLDVRMGIFSLFITVTILLT